MLKFRLIDCSRSNHLLHRSVCPKAEVLCKGHSNDYTTHLLQSLRVMHICPNPVLGFFLSLQLNAVPHALCLTARAPNRPLRDSLDFQLYSWTEAIYQSQQLHPSCHAHIHSCPLEDSDFHCAVLFLSAIVSMVLKFVDDTITNNNTTNLFSAWL